MCVLCNLNPVNAIDGTHETLAGVDVPAHLQFEALSETLRAFLTQVDDRFPILDWDGFLDKAGWLAGEIGWGGLPAGPGTGSQLPENELVGSAVFNQNLSAPGGAGTLQTLADYLTTGFWDDFWGAGTQHKFNLTDTGVNAKDGVLYYDIDGFSGIDGGDSNGIAADRQQYIRDILDVYGDLLGITFIEATNASGIEADIYFKDNYLGAAYANSEFDAATGYIDYSYVNVGSDWSGGTETVDDYTLQTFFHEIGHALGLGHQGLYNAGSGTPTYNDATWANDTWNYTMMSYWEQAYYGDATSAYLFGPKVVDLIALNDLYADQGYGTQNAFTGNTTYGFNTTVTGAQNWLWSQLSTYADQMSFTIADGAGIDTVDFSGYSDDQLIDLRASDPSATFLYSSDIGGLTGNMSIAAGTIIENAVGGTGDDTFIGNEYGNVLTGNNGNDTFTGNGGDDEFYGGIGDDLVIYAASIGNYSVTILTDFLQIVGEGVDLVFDDIEFFLFGTATYTYDEVMAFADGNSRPEAGDDTAVTWESQAVAINVLDNDSDADDDAITLVSVEGDADGTVTLASGAVVTFSSDGNVNYDPNGAFDSLFDGQTATDSFSYEISDELGATATATVDVTVNGTGTPPIGEYGSVVMDDQWVTVQLEQSYDDPVVIAFVTTNNGTQLIQTRVRNVDGDSFELSLQEPEFLDGSHVDESVSYVVVEAGTYQLADGTIIEAGTVQTNLVAQAGFWQGVETVGFAADFTETPVVLTSTNTTNDSEWVTTRQRNVSEDGFQVALSEQEANADGHGSETVGFLAIQAGDGSLVETVSGIAVGSSWSSTETVDGVLLAAMQTISGSDPGVLRSSEGAGQGEYQFKILEDQSKDSETYHTNEAVAMVLFKGGSGLLTASQTVLNGKPVAGDDAASTTESQTIGLNVLDNDSDPDDDVIMLASVEGETDGSVTLASGALVTFSADGNLTYDPNGAFDGLNDGESDTDTFTYAVSDGNGGTDTATATITINGSGTPNTPPVARNDAFVTGEASPVNGNLFADNGSGADSDADFGTLELISVNGDGDGSASLASGAIVTFADDGAFSYDPNGAFDGLNDGQSDTDSFTYLVSDGQGGTDTATATITINGSGTPNTPPVARNDAFVTGEASPVNGNLFADNGSGADSDADFGTLELVSVNGDGDGSASLASGAIVTFADDGAFSYDPNGAFDGLNDGQSDTDSFTYLVSDGQGGTDTATATITVNGSGIAPVDPTDPITIDFEDEPTGTFSGVDGLDFSGLSVANTTRLNGSKAGQTGSSGDFTIIATDGDFDLDSLEVRSGFTRSTVQVEISAYDDGVLVGTETLTLSRSGNDIDFGSDFDSIDQVTFSSNTKVYVDDLDLIV